MVVSLLLSRIGHFNPRPPRGGRLSEGLFVLFSFLISIHAPREGGDGAGKGIVQLILISIHAPREGGDGMAEQGHGAVRNISIHAPREGGDPSRSGCMTKR